MSALIYEGGSQHHLLPAPADVTVISYGEEQTITDAVRVEWRYILYLDGLILRSTDLIRADHIVVAHTGWDHPDYPPPAHLVAAYQAHVADWRRRTEATERTAS